MAWRLHRAGRSFRATGLEPGVHGKGGGWEVLHFGPAGKSQRTGAFSRMLGICSCCQVALNIRQWELRERSWELCRELGGRIQGKRQIASPQQSSGGEAEEQDCNL